jgi:hypothetical protein
VVAAPATAAGLAGVVTVGLATVAQEVKSSNKRQIQIVFLSMVVIF